MVPLVQIPERDSLPVQIYSQVEGLLDADNNSMLDDVRIHPNQIYETYLRLQNKIQMCWIGTDASLPPTRQVVENQRSFHSKAIIPTFGHTPMKMY